MNDILLVNKINPKDYSTKKQKVFFQIGGVNLPKNEERLHNVLKSSRLVSQEDVIYKYNGIEINVLVQSIPIIIRLLSENNISVYSVYGIYDPRL